MEFLNDLRYWPSALCNIWWELPFPNWNIILIDTSASRFATNKDLLILAHAHTAHHYWYFEMTLWLGSMSRCLWMKCTLIVLSSLVDCDKNLKVFLLVLQIVSDDKMCINCIFILLFRRRFNNGIFHTWESSILCNCEKNSFYKKTIDKIND